ncbi:MAG: DUF1285 domain-containing protein [Syntrophales bacterium]|nr:DUF1285 domain-containing protein [Syntrophales bacterium]
MNNEITACDIKIDKEGIWYFRGEEMFRREIVNFFYQNIKLDAAGRYLIMLPGENGDRCYIDVEDTAFVVKRVEFGLCNDNSLAAIEIGLSDDTIELLDPKTLRIGQDNVVYCTVRNGMFKARFSRAAYYQLAEHIEYDSERDLFFLRLKDQRFTILNQ